MDTRRFTRFLEAFDRLTPSQTAAAIERLETHEALHIINAGAPPVCPRCAGGKSQRWGTTPKGIQRHRCSSCGATFTARSGTPLWRVHRPDRLLALVVDMLALRDVSCRASARRLGVDHTTVWRWRHQVLAWMPGQAPQALEGLVEMDEAYQRESRKGSREGQTTTQTPRLCRLHRAFHGPRPNANPPATAGGASRSWASFRAAHARI